MRALIEKNKAILLDEIEQLSEEKINDYVASKLSTYRGAYKALCMIGKEWGKSKEMVAYVGETPARTANLDGDTEFEQVVMRIPTDKAHMSALTSVIADHMESLKVLNNRAYKNIILRLKEVAGG